MIEIIWWVKTIAMMDAWTIEHVLSWLSVWHLVKSNNQSVFKKFFGIESNNIRTKYFDLLWVLFIAYLWETIEHYLEVWIAWKYVEYWFQWVEYWPNRIIFDPLMLVLWYIIAKKYPKLVIPARICSIVWLFVHIFVFPHSMYLHELF